MFVNLVDRNKWNGSILKFPICHHLPYRTFNIWGYYFPVCSRCTGLYMGAILFLTCLIYFSIEYTFTLIIMAFIITIPCILDGFTQYLGFRESNNELRFMTGFAAGFGAAMFISLNLYMIIPSLLISINLEILNF
jgi:uncharacterized membrane protein